MDLPGVRRSVMLWVILAFAICLASASSTYALSAPGDEAPILGRVTAGPSGLPGIAVSVYHYSAYGSAWVKVGGAVTDATGDYVATRPDGSPFPGNEWYLVHFADPSGAYLPRYFDSVDDLEGSGGGESLPDTGSVTDATPVLIQAGTIVFNPSVDQSLLPSTAPAGGTIRGHLYDAYRGGWMNMGGGVDVEGPGVFERRYVNLDGSFSIGPLPEGSYSVHFFAAIGGYPEQYWDHASDPASATLVEVRAGEISRVEGTLRPFRTIAGHVYCADTGKPLPDAMVEMWGRDPVTGELSYDKIKNTDTDGNGFYVLPGDASLPQGTFIVEAVPRGMKYLPAWYGGTTLPAKATAVTIEERTNLEGVDIWVSTRPTIVGRLAAKDGEPIGDMEVIPWRRDPSGVWRAATSTFTRYDGTFSLGVEQGTYRLEFFDDGRTPQDGSDDVRAYYESVTTFDKARTVAVPSAGVVSGIDDTLTVPVSKARRVYGDDRYQTTLQVSRATFPDGGCPQVVLVSGESHPDALSAAALAGDLNAPLLLTHRATLAPGTIEELKRLGAWLVTVVGGTPSVSEDVVENLRWNGLCVVRLAGDDRYETSARVAQVVTASDGATTTALLLRGDTFPDALGAAPLAYSRRMPVLLTRPSSLPSSVSSAVAGCGIRRLLVVGDTSSVSSVALEAPALAGVSVERIAQGRHRYATAALLARYAVRAGWLSFTHVGVASGASFPDGLAGGPACGSRNGVLLLTDPRYVPAATAEVLSQERSRITDIDVFGGPSSISRAVQAQLAK